MNLNAIIARIKISFKNRIAYRIDLFLDIIMAPFFFLIIQILWTIIYSYNGLDKINGFTLNENISYLAISSIMTIFLWTNILEDVGSLIKWGNIGGILLQPQGLFEIHISEIIGQKIPGWIIKVPLSLFLIITMFHINLPISYQSILFFIISIIISFFLINLFKYSLGLLTFFEKSFWLFNMFGFFLINFFSGNLMPIDFYPNFLRTIINYLPFKHIYYSPIMILLNKYTMIQVIQVLGLQLFWLIILYVISRILFKLGMNKFTSQGG